MSSSRLPGKALMPMIDKMSMLDILLYRVRLAKMVSGVILATSEHKSDDPLVDWSHKNSVDCFRGSLNDVLGRLVGCIKSYKLDDCIEVLGDNPMVDPDDIDRCVTEYNSGLWDYVATSTTEYKFAEELESYPIGVRVQCFKTKILKEADEEYVDNYSREHSSSFIYGMESKYRRNLIRWPHKETPIKPGLNLAVNTLADFERNIMLFKKCGADASLPKLLSALPEL